MIITYEVVQHDGGWAYRLHDVYSETFGSREEAAQAAERAGAKQKVDAVRIVGAGDDEKMFTPRDDSDDDTPDGALDSDIRSVDVEMHANGDIDRETEEAAEAGYLNDDETFADETDDNRKDEKSKREEDEELDEALRETFPASDPVSPSNTTKTGGPHD